jgi:hypothetical protein
LFAQNVPNVVHPVTDSLETEIEQHGKVVISTEMDVSCPAILIGTFSCGMLRLKKAHMTAYDKQLIDLQRYTTRKQFFREGG